MRTFVIYKYTNKTNGKLYVGQTYNLAYRHGKHIRNARTPSRTSLIDLAMAKYGIENFTLEVIEYINEPFADEAEAFWIHELNSLKPNGYNIKPGGNSAKGWKHTEEAKQKMSKNRKRVYGKDHHLYGKPLSEAHKQKVSKTRTGMKLGPQSPEDRKKKSEVHIKRYKTKLVIYLEKLGLTIEEIKRLHYEENYRVMKLSRLAKLDERRVRDILDGKYD